MGDNCGAVADVQMALTELGYRPGPVDGIFGSGTEAALLRFQADQGLVADAIIGPSTADQLGLGGGSSPYGVGESCESRGASNQCMGGTDSAATAPAPDAASVDRFRFYEVTTDSLNVRSGPGLEYPVVAAIYDGDRLEGRRDSSGWVALRTGDWVSGDFLTEVVPGQESAVETPAPSQPAGTSAPSRIQVKAEVLNVRSQPSLTAPVVGTLLAGEIYETSGQVTEDGWVQLAWGDWVAGTYVVSVDGGMTEVSVLETLEANAPEAQGGTTLASVSTLGADLLVRSAPGGEVVDSLTNGTTVELSGRSQDGWVQLRNGYWVAQDYLA